MSEEFATQDLVELVRHAIDASHRGDYDAIMRLIAPDVVWESSDGLVVRVLAGQDLEEARAGAGQLAEARG